MQEDGRMKNNEEKRRSVANPSNTDMVLLPGSSPKPYRMEILPTLTAYGVNANFLLTGVQIWKVPEC